jgi:hypothetical protein
LRIWRLELFGCCRWAIDSRVLLVAAWTPYCLGVIAYLSRTAGQALDDFRPALDLSDRQFASLRHEFTVLPVRPVVVFNLIGLILVLGSFLFLPETGAPYTSSLLMGSVTVAVSGLGISLSMAAIYQTFRHLDVVRVTYRSANRLTLFQGNLL